MDDKPTLFDIDGDVDPFVPHGWTLVHHRRSGRLAFDPKNVDLYFDPAQMTEVVNGSHVKTKLGEAPVLNANFFDFFEHNRHAVPHHYRRNTRGRYQTILFLGTEFKVGSRLVARCMTSSDLGWYFEHMALDMPFTDVSVAIHRLRAT